MNHYGLTNLVDRRTDLPRSHLGGPQEQRLVASKSGIVVHYNGPPVPLTMPDWNLIRSDALYHIRKDWDHGEAGTQHGDGLMYHLAIERDGTADLCRDFADVLWHCGTRKNGSALAFFVVMGGDQRATKAQLATLDRLCEEAIDAALTSRARVTGHLEESPSSCPGTLMADFILPFRANMVEEVPPVADGHYFQETGYYVGGAFFRFWTEFGGLPIFGYPLSNEQQGPCEDSVTRTVQWFERARMEYHPDEPDGYTVLLTRLGSEIMDRARVPAP